MRLILARGVLRAATAGGNRSWMADFLEKERSRRHWSTKNKRN